jgi:hypothetical protein
MHAAVRAPNMCVCSSYQECVNLQAPVNSEFIGNCTKTHQPRVACSY